MINDCVAAGGMRIAVKSKYSDKAYPSVNLSLTNPTWIELEPNQGRHGGKPATNHLSTVELVVSTYIHYTKCII
jgi:hypothetical protein